MSDEIYANVLLKCIYLNEAYLFCNFLKVANNFRLKFMLSLTF